MRFLQRAAAPHEAGWEARKHLEEAHSSSSTDWEAAPCHLEGVERRAFGQIQPTDPDEAFQYMMFIKTEAPKRWNLVCAEWRHLSYLSDFLVLLLHWCPQVYWEVCDGDGGPWEGSLGFEGLRPWSTKQVCGAEGELKQGKRHMNSSDKILSSLVCFFLFFLLMRAVEPKVLQGTVNKTSLAHWLWFTVVWT